MRGRKPVLKPAPNAIDRAPQPPAWLGAEAKLEWRRVMPGLIERRVLTDADMATFENYCFAIGEIRRARKTLAKEGDTITSTRGDVKRHPAAQTAFQSLTEARRLAAELGLTPASRGKAAAMGGKHDDKGWADLDL
jgi:P27 family predicted phage terminase small subunit